MKTITTAKSIGLVLSGGGVRGMAHIGLIKALKEHDIQVGHVAGSSIGALVGALYANGNSIDEMLKFFKDTPLFNYNYFALGKLGVIDTDRYFKMFKGYFPDDSFEALEKQLCIVATDLMKGRETPFTSGELIYPLLASAALSPVFSPVEIGGTLYADGGIMNNFPKEYLNPHCDFIIGSHVSIVGELHKKALKNTFQLTARITGLMIYAASHAKLGACDLFIEPEELEQIGLLDKKDIEKAYQIGYDRASWAIEEHLESAGKRDYS